MVEDEPAVLTATAELLSRADYDVVGVGSAGEAIRWLETSRFDLLVTDFSLGRETAEVVILALRRLQRSVPVILVTGTPTVVPAWIQTGDTVARMLEKPYRAEALAEAAATVLAERERSIAALLPRGVEEMVHRVVDQESIVAITDRKGAIVYANDRFCEISGYTRPELLGQNHRLLKSGKHPPAFYKELWSTILGGRVWRGEICNRAKDGHIYYVDTVISPLRTAGLITHFIALRTDITAKKEMEAALDDRRKQEEDNRRMAALGRMANGLLHDLNNILTGVMGIATDPGSPTRDAMLHDAIGRMAQLTRALRDYSSGRPAKPEPFLLNPLVACACSLVRHRKGVPTGLSIEEHFEATRGLEVVGNEGQIFEVVLNVVVNAMEASASVAKPRIVVSTERDDGQVGVRVIDNGPGVPGSLAQTVFEPYASSKGAGRGIGLSVSRNIALAHRGDLKLVHPGGDGLGACFLLTLPVQEAPSGSSLQEAPSQASRVVLVSEDEADVRRLIARDAGQAGLRAIDAGDAADLLALATQMKEVLAAAIIDSCEVDSDQGAVACLRRIKPDVPIILISANLTSQGRRMTPWGEVENLPKPFTSEALVKTLDAMVSKV